MVKEIKKTLAIFFVFAVSLGLGVIVFTPRGEIDAPIVNVPVTHKRVNPWVDIQMWRVRNNKRPYIKHDLLCEFADSRIYQLELDWSHNGFYDSPELTSSAFSTFSLFGENLSRDVEKENLLQAWLDSPKHKELLETNYEFGCLVCRGVFCVLELAK